MVVVLPGDRLHPSTPQGTTHRVVRDTDRNMWVVKGLPTPKISKL